MCWSESGTDWLDSASPDGLLPRKENFIHLSGIHLVQITFREPPLMRPRVNDREIFLGRAHPGPRRKGRQSEWAFLVTSVNLSNQQLEHLDGLVIFDLLVSGTKFLFLALFLWCSTALLLVLLMYGYDISALPLHELSYLFITAHQKNTVVMQDVSAM